MPEPPATGRCLCGNIRYRIGGDPVWCGYCHCESCRRFTGAVVTSWAGVAARDLEFPGARPAVFESAGVRRGFCPACGSSLTYEADRFPGYVQVHVGTLDDPAAFAPRAHVHCGERVPWFDVADELPRFEGSVTSVDDDWMKS